MTSAKLFTLEQRFGSETLSFDEHAGLLRAHVHTPEATATIYLQGAHLTAWQPTGHAPVIFLSRKSEFGPGKPIRGGVPIAFPWFSGRSGGLPGPSHGFARVQEWTLASVGHEGAGVRLRFTLGPTATSRELGFDAFALTLTVTVGAQLQLALEVRNEALTPLHFEEAFHTYFNVVDIHEVQVDGLEPTAYIDKADGFQPKPAAGKPIRFTETLDRIYPRTTATCTIHDEARHRLIRVAKQGSATSVVWNPWKELPDLGPWEWHEMVAVETANIGADAITLAPGATHALRATISVEKA